MSLSQKTWWPLRLPRNLVSMGMPFDFSEDFPKLIGIMIERWTLIEDELSRSAGYLLDGNMQAGKAIIYSLNATKMRIDMVGALTRELMPDGPERRGFVYLLEKLSKLSQERNEYVHGEFWHGDKPDALDLIVRRPMTATSFSIRSVTTKTLETHIENVEYRYSQMTVLNAEQTEFFRSRHLKGLSVSRRRPP